MHWREMRDGTYTDLNPGRAQRKKAKQEQKKKILEHYMNNEDIDAFFLAILYKI